jgi:SAM-dependent methyltransferase
MSARPTDPVLAEYDRLAPRYDRRWSYYIGATVRETLRRLDLVASGRLLDVGCGTGALLQAVVAAAPGLRLAGVDPCGEMLRVARGKLPASVELRQAYAEGLPFGDSAFDTVVCTNSFHYFRRPADALREMMRVLRPGGRVIITDWCDDFLTCRLCDLALRWLDSAHFRAYSTAECRQQLEKAGFSSVAVERYKIDWLWGLMTARGERPGA